MKYLGVFYSRTGVTRKVAKDISRRMNCDMEEVIQKQENILTGQ